MHVCQLLVILSRKQIWTQFITPHDVKSCTFSPPGARAMEEERRTGDVSCRWPGWVKVRGFLLGKSVQEELWGLSEKRRLWGDLGDLFNTKKDEDKRYSRSCFDKTRGDGFKPKKNQFRLAPRKTFYNKGEKILAQVAQRSGRCPMPGNIQGQAWRSLL